MKFNPNPLSVMQANQAESGLQTLRTSGCCLTTAHLGMGVA